MKKLSPEEFTRAAQQYSHGTRQVTAVMRAANITPQQVRGNPGLLAGAGIAAKCMSILAEYERQCADDATREADDATSAMAAQQTQRARARLLSIESLSDVQASAPAAVRGARQ